MLLTLLPFHPLSAPNHQPSNPIAPPPSRRKKRETTFLQQTTPQSLLLTRPLRHALSVNNLGSRLVILLLGDPAVLEGRQLRQHASADPHHVLPIRRGDHAHLDARRHQRGELFVHAIAHAVEEGRASRQHHVVVQIAAQIHVAARDRLVHRVVDAVRRQLAARQRRVEQDFGHSEALAVDLNQLRDQLHQFIFMRQNGFMQFFLCFLVRNKFFLCFYLHYYLV